ncbi:hypothetical protein [Sorangium sp. So ce1153]|uniref:hypothetical protein n=1 Tax=Sorangium sp. So ce1153 TaxID=3133333 RepID=UPI003F6050B1
MPRVTFVNEHRTVEAAPGRLLSDIAAEVGIAVCRETFRGTGIGDYTCWVKGEPGATSPPTFLERLLGAKGQRRMANRTRVLGDVQVWTQAGPGNRLRAPRPIAPPPSPATDPEAARKPIDASGSAAFPYGDPRAVGQGKREPIAAGALEAKAAKEKKAKAAAAAPTKAPEGAAAAEATAAAPEAAVKEKKAAAKTPKAAAAVSEAAAPVPGASTAVPDAAAPVPGASTAVSEAAAPVPGASTAVPDAAAPVPGASTAVPDAAATISEPAATAAEVATEPPEAKAPGPASTVKETVGGASE